MKLECVLEMMIAVKMIIDISGGHLSVFNLIKSIKKFSINLILPPLLSLLLTPTLYPKITNSHQASKYENYTKGSFSRLCDQAINFSPIRWENNTQCFFFTPE